MKLQKGQQIFVQNWVLKSHSQSSNTGFVMSERSERRQFGDAPNKGFTIEYPGAYLVVARATVLDCEVCESCRRLYGFNRPGARAQCECRGEEILS